MMNKNLRTIIQTAQLITDEQKEALLNLSPLTPNVEQKIKFMIFLGNAIVEQTITDMTDEQKQAYEQGLQQIYKDFLSAAEADDATNDDDLDSWLESNLTTATN